MTSPFRIALIDDHGLCRRGLAELLEARAGVQVVGATASADEAVELATQETLDLIVMDLRMSPTDGFQLLKRFRDSGSEVPVVILTMSDNGEDLGNMLRLGVRGYLLKDMEPDQIVESIVRAAGGEFVVAPAMALKLAELLREGKSRQERENSLGQLTAREREILGHVARGLSNKAIARQLGISHDTVKLHVRHILAKLNLGSRVEAAVFAIENRVETLDDGHHGLRQAASVVPAAGNVGSKPEAGSGH
ncbi:MAG: response regulator [Burkholderiaceae bacterium]